MDTRVIEMSGQVYGNLTVLRRDTAPHTRKGARWLCRCDCGKVVSVMGNDLRSRNTRSCGCRRIQNRRETMEANGKKDGPKNWGKKPVKPNRPAPEAPEVIREAVTEWITDKADKPANLQIVLVRTQGTGPKSTAQVDLVRYARGRANPWYSLTKREAIPDFVVTGWMPAPSV